MTLTLLRAKLHRIHVTEACLDYMGSLTVDQDLMDAAGLYEHEKILCADVENGNRFETYVIGQSGRPSDRDVLRPVHARGGARPPAAHRFHRRGVQPRNRALNVARYSPAMTEWMSPSPHSAITSLSIPSATPEADLMSGSVSRNSSSIG